VHVVENLIGKKFHKLTVLLRHPENHKGGDSQWICFCDCGNDIPVKDNDKGYYKDNCRWATKVEQANNTRKNVYYEFDGERKTLTQWCREFNVNYRSVVRLLQKGLSFEDAIDSCVKSDKD
jgi:hypothetical protein